MPLYTTKAAPRARLGLLLVSWFAGHGACGLLGTLLLALLVCLGAAFPQRLQAQTEVAKLLSSDIQADDLFGFSVAISGDRALVGAQGGGLFAGAAASPASRVHQ